MKACGVFDRSPLRNTNVLCGKIPQKVFLVVDKHRVHVSAKVNRWLEKHANWIRMFLLPYYVFTIFCSS